jgi:hypothetical protein
LSRFSMGNPTKLFASATGSVVTSSLDTIKDVVASLVHYLPLTQSRNT